MTTTQTIPNALASLDDITMPVQRKESTASAITKQNILLGSNTVIELLINEDRQFIGIGGVTVGAVPLRHEQTPISVCLDTPQGILYTRFEVEEITEGDAGVEVSLRAIGLPWGRGEYCDDYSQSILWPSDSPQPIIDRLTLVLQPQAYQLAGQHWEGFSYSFKFSSQSREIHRLMTQATWEIGGRIKDNVVLSQGQCNQPVYRGGKEELFTTACLRTLDKYGAPQGYSFQLGPRAGLIQGFDFQYSPEGVLLQYWPQFESISSLVESPPGKDYLHIIDEYRFDLTKSVSTLPKHVLFAPGSLPDHEARNLWKECLHTIYGKIREQYGVEPTIAVPEAGLSYRSEFKPKENGQSNLNGWQAPAQSQADNQAILHYNFADVEVPHTDVLHSIGDHLIPRLAAQGIKRFFPEAISESDVTVHGMQRKLEAGPHTDFVCASVCATHRFFPSEFWGGIKGWRHMYEKAQAVGMEIGHWFAPHFSPRSPIFKEHPEYLMIDRLGMPAGGGYGSNIITVADWNTGIYDVVLNDLKQWKKEGGLDYLFVDSYSNMGMLQTNHRESMRTNYAAFARLLAELQEIGIKSFTFESVSALGIGRFGVTDLRGDLIGQDKSVAGQNDFGWWVGEEDMLIDCSLILSPRKREMEELQQVQFRGMANRAYIHYYGVCGMDSIMPEWWTRANKIYNLVLPHMQNRRLLSDQRGVQWSDGKTTVYWLYKSQKVKPSSGWRIERATEEGYQELSQEELYLEPWQVYRVHSQGDLVLE